MHETDHEWCTGSNPFGIRSGIAGSMDWGVVLTVVAVVAIAIVLVMIITMLIGTIRSTRRNAKPGRRENWSHTQDKEFLPWEDDDH